MPPGSEVSKKALRPSSSKSAICTCMPLPEQSVRGLGMKLAYTPWAAATSFTTIL